MTYGVWDIWYGIYVLSGLNKQVKWLTVNPPAQLGPPGNCELQNLNSAAYTLGLIPTSMPMTTVAILQGTNR